MRTEDLLAVEEVRRKAESGRARELRVAARLTLNDVASVVGVSESTVARWEQGQRLPRTRAAIKYARALARIEERLAEVEAAS